MPVAGAVFGYDLDAVLIAVAPPVLQKGFAYIGKKREPYIQAMKTHYQTTAIGLNPEQRRFHVVTACRAEGVRPFIRIWLGGHFIGRPLSVTFLDAERSLQNTAEFKAAIITRYAMTDFCDGSAPLLRALDLKLPNHVRLHIYERGGKMEPFHRTFNRRKNDGPDL
jgi:hypothetical protein